MIYTISELTSDDVKSLLPRRSLARGAITEKVVLSQADSNGVVSEFKELIINGYTMYLLDNVYVHVITEPHTDATIQSCRELYLRVVSNCRLLELHALADAFVDTIKKLKLPYGVYRVCQEALLVTTDTEYDTNYHGYIIHKHHRQFLQGAIPRDAKYFSVDLDEAFQLCKQMVSIEYIAYYLTAQPFEDIVRIFSMASDTKSNIKGIRCITLALNPSSLKTGNVVKGEFMCASGVGLNLELFSENIVRSYDVYSVIESQHIGEKNIGDIDDRFQRSKYQKPHEYKFWLYALISAAPFWEHKAGFKPAKSQTKGSDYILMYKDIMPADSVSVVYQSQKRLTNKSVHSQEVTSRVKRTRLHSKK